MKKIIYTLSLALFATSLFAQQPTFITDSLDQYIKTGIKDWDIPGLAIAIVKDGKPVMIKGYGVKDMKTNAPVDENTLFMIASNSKLFTGTSIANLAYQKKLSLNDPITKYFPNFSIYDKNASALLTVKDLMGHKLGTKTFQGDFTFWDSNLSSEEIMNRMKLMKPIYPFRQDFGYCNSCFLTAGEVIPKVTNETWNQYVENNILKPLGMNNTYTVHAGMSQRVNVSKPYTNQFTGVVTEIPYDNVDNLGPAASMISNVSDLSKWLMLQLDSGKYEGKQILPWPVLRMTRDVNTALSSRKNGETHFTDYGLGVFEADDAGKQVYWHTGGAFGFVSNVCFVPELNLGISILTNMDNQSFFELLRHQILNAYLGKPYQNLSKDALSGYQKTKADDIEKLKTFQARVGKEKTELALSAYAGTYHHPLYGDITITTSGKDLRVDMKTTQNLTAKMQYMDKDEWLMTYSNLGYGIYATKFKIEKGKVIGLTIPT
ncbi:MAG: serine hydrolase, partial [Bacteroidetes bacterium]|nr:serine hydrolase [Bacteroidota bacterium]